MRVNNMNCPECGEELLVSGDVIICRTCAENRLKRQLVDNVLTRTLYEQIRIIIDNEEITSSDKAFNILILTECTHEAVLKKVLVPPSHGGFYNVFGKTKYME